MLPSVAISQFLTHVLFCFVLFVPRVHALVNTTVDDQRPLITYTNPTSWTRINDTTTAIFDYEGGHMLTSDPAATAVFNFTGIAVYFMSARWPYPVSTTVTLDDGPDVILDLTDHTLPDAGGGPATVKYEIVARAVGLQNGTHTLTVSIGAGQIFALVDAFVYTTLLANETAPPLIGNAPTNQLSPVPPSTPPSNKGSKSRKLAAGLSVFAILLFLILLAIIIIFTRRRRARTGPSSSGSSPYPFPGNAHSPLGGGARTMRAAYADTDEKGAEEKAALRITNPDPASNSPASATGPSMAMPIPVKAGTGAPTGPATDGDSGRRLRSPRTYYGALREMTYSPTRAYPVQPVRRPNPPLRDSSDWDSSEAHTLPMPTPNAGRYAAVSEYRPPSDAGTAPTRTTVYSQVTALALEEEEFSRAHGGRVESLLPPPPVLGGRHRASARSSVQAGGTAGSAAQGEERWAYPQSSLAYVPVFKSSASRI